MEERWLTRNWFKAGFLFSFFILASGILIFSLAYSAAEPQEKEEPVRIVQVLTSTSTEQLSRQYSLPSIIKQWYPAVTRINCYVRDSEGLLVIQAGSGFLKSESDGIRVLTNRHVVTDEHGVIPELCTVKLPNSEDPYIVSNEGNNTADFDIFVSNNEALDWGYVMIRRSNKLFEEAASKLKYCTERATLGTPVVLLGYPEVGAETDVTVTQGIISGYDGSYYITDAKIGHGNSGGIAVQVDTNTQESCLLGIPTFAKVGEVLSLGRILDVQEILKSYTSDVTHTE